MNNPGKLIRLASMCLGVVKRTVSEYSSKFSRKDYTQHQLMTLVLLMYKYKRKYREFVELVEPMSELLEMLRLDKVPHFTTLNKFFIRMKNAVFSVLLQITAGQLSGRASVDATGMDRRYNSKHYVKRCKMRIKSMKTTLLIDTDEQKVFGVHCTASRKHDTQILLPLVKKTRQKINLLCADRGYDDKKIRDYLKKHGIRTLIPYRVFDKKQVYWNLLMNKKDVHQRSKSETVNSVVKRRYGDYLASKGFWRQYKEAKLLCVVYNIDRELKKVFVFSGGFLRSLSDTMCNTWCLLRGRSN
jgi:IS5 family transposase